MLSRMTLALPGRSSRPSYHPSAYGSTRPPHSLLLLLLIALSVLIAQSYVARPCPAMPFSDCAMAAGGTTAARSTVPVQEQPCCPFQKMANCVGVGCYSIFMAPVGTRKLDAPLMIVGHWFPGVTTAPVHPFSFNIFHPPRAALP